MCVCVCNVPLEFSQIDDPIESVTEKKSYSDVRRFNALAQTYHIQKYVYTHHIYIYTHISETTKATNKKDLNPVGQPMNKPSNASGHISFVQWVQSTLLMALLGHSIYFTYLRRLLIRGQKKHGF